MRARTLFAAAVVALVAFGSEAGAATQEKKLSTTTASAVRSALRGQSTADTKTSRQELATAGSKRGSPATRASRKSSTGKPATTHGSIRATASRTQATKKPGQKALNSPVRPASHGVASAEKSGAESLWGFASTSNYGGFFSGDPGAESLSERTSASGAVVSTGQPDIDAWCQSESCTAICAPPLSHPLTLQLFGDYLYLRPGSDKIAYAVPINGAIVPPIGAPPVQVGREATVDCGFESGFRTGGSLALNSRADMGVTYTHFEAQQADQAGIDAPFVLRSLVNHPGTRAAPSNFLDAAAEYDISFDLGDVDYRRILLSDGFFAVQYLVGARYAHLEQEFRSQFSNVTTIEDITSNVNFDGGGIRVGLEAERHACKSGLMIYGRGVASFLAGEFSGRFTQGDNIRGPVVDAGWREDRVVPILDLELGVGWASSNGRLRVTGGYLFSAWYNVVETEGFIDAVRSNSSVAVADTLTFDGMMVRTELRF